MSCTKCKGDCPLTVRDKAAVCFFCPRRSDYVDPKGVRVSICTIDRIEIQDRKACPRGVFSDTGLVYWLGVLWYGVPTPHRLALWLMHHKHPKPSSWNFCGCIKVLRDLWYSLSLHTPRQVRQAT